MMSLLMEVLMVVPLAVYRKNQMKGTWIGRQQVLHKSTNMLCLVFAFDSRDVSESYCLFARYNEAKNEFIGNISL